MAWGRRLGGILAAGVVAACTATTTLTPARTLQPSGTPATTSSVATATASPSPTPAVLSGLAAGWVGHLEPRFDGLQFAAMSRLGDREVVVAATASGPVALTTIDGSAWLPATGLGSAAGIIGGVAVGGELADGASLPGALLTSYPRRVRLAATCEQGAPLRATAWTSADGATWLEVPRQASMANVPMLAISPAVSGPGYVAVGRLSHCNSPDGLSHSAAWSSKDGIDWSLTGSSVFRNAALLDVDGGIAVGTDRDDVDQYPGDARPAVWYNPDGRAWQPVEAGFGWGVMHFVAALSPIVIAAGATAPHGEGNAVPATWLRDEEGAWTGPNPAPGWFSSMVVVPDPSQWVLAAADGQAFATKDGRIWIPLTPPGQAIRAVGSWASGTIAIGALNDADPAAPGIVWIGPRSWPGP